MKFFNKGNREQPVFENKKKTREGLTTKEIAERVARDVLNNLEHIEPVKEGEEKPYPQGAINIIEDAYAFIPQENQKEFLDTVKKILVNHRHFKEDSQYVRDNGKPIIDSLERKVSVT